MNTLNLPAYDFKIRSTEGKQEIFDLVRKRYVALTPEEWVRQHVVQYLVHSFHVPSSLIVVEKSLVLNKMKKRADVLVYGISGSPVMIVECKSPNVKISQKTFEQVARYNMVFKVKYLLVTNGLDHFCCLIDFENQHYTFLENIPDYSQMIGKAES
jgi:hypothetical protein